MTQTAQREQVHRLIDSVSQEQLVALSALLQVMVDPTDRKFAVAPFEDESVSPEENAQVAAATGPMYSMENVMAELGISGADLDRQRREDELRPQSS